MAKTTKAELMDEFSFKDGSIQLWDFGDSFVVSYYSEMEGERLFRSKAHTFKDELDARDFAASYIMEACYELAQ